MPDHADETDPDRRHLCTVDAVIMTIEDERLRVLLHRRPRAPYDGAWALPGGWIHADEDADTQGAMQRVIKDKTGLPGYYLEQLRTYSGPVRDPRGWSVSVAHLALVPRADLALEDRPDVTLADVDALPPLAFDHDAIVADGVERLRGKGAYSSLPAALLGEEFTLSELKRAYEIVLGNAIDLSSFKRKLIQLDMIEESGKKTKSGSKRPAMLYRLTGPARTFNRSLGGQ